MQGKRLLLFILFCLLPSSLFASIIESTVGTAVVNDATATHYNPAALTVLKRPQLLTLGSQAYLRTHFSGQSIQANTGFVLQGSSTAQNHYFLPAVYVGVPFNSRVTAGLAIIANFFNHEIEDNSILRYAQSSNDGDDLDLEPGVGIKLTDQIAIGASFTASHAKFVLNPITGFPSLNIPDSQSRNVSSGTGYGYDMGALYKPTDTTSIGVNYRSAVTYRLSGTSTLFPANLVSHQYRFTFWTPARAILSVNHFITKSFGFIGTVGRIQWSIFKQVSIHNIANLQNSRAVIVPNATVNFFLHDAWFITLGSHYRVTPQWIVRLAGTFNQSPANAYYQIGTGDSFIIGLSTGYEINKNVTLDGGYARAFIQNKNIHVTGRNRISGVNEAFREAVSVKLTLNL